MSFFTLVPNYTPNVVRINNPFQFQPQINIQSTIIILSTALRNSIFNYEKQFFALKSSEIAQNTPKMQQSVAENKKQREERKSKEQDKRSHLSIVIQKAIIEQKTTSSSIANSKQSPIITPKSLDQHNIPQLQTVINLKKTQNTKHLKQPSKQSSKDNEGASVPLVDLIDCAYLPGLGVSRAELETIRQKLQKRRVEHWKANDKGRKDRRELRMLNN